MKGSTNGQLVGVVGEAEDGGVQASVVDEADEVGGIEEGIEEKIKSRNGTREDCEMDKEEEQQRDHLVTDYGGRRLAGSQDSVLLVLLGVGFGIC